MEKINQKSKYFKEIINQLLSFEDLIYYMYAPIDYFDTWNIMILGINDDNINEYKITSLGLTNWEIYTLMKITFIFEKSLNLHTENGDEFIELNNNWKDFYGLQKADYQKFRKLRTQLLGYENFNQELMKMLEGDEDTNYGWWDKDRIKKLYNESIE